MKLENGSGAQSDGGEALFSPDDITMLASFYQGRGRHSDLVNAEPHAVVSPPEQSCRSAVLQWAIRSREHPSEGSRLAAAHSFSVAEKKKARPYVPGLGTRSRRDGERGGVHLL